MKWTEDYDFKLEGVPGEFRLRQNLLGRTEMYHNGRILRKPSRWYKEYVLNMGEDDEVAFYIVNEAPWGLQVEHEKRRTKLQERLGVGGWTLSLLPWLIVLASWIGFVAIAEGSQSPLFDMEGWRSFTMILWIAFPAWSSIVAGSIIARRRYSCGAKLLAEICTGLIMSAAGVVLTLIVLSIICLF